MTKSMLAEKISQKLPEFTKKQVETILNTLFDSMKEAIWRGEKIEIRGFGIFRIKERKAKIARNPKTGEKVNISARKTIHFKIGKAFHKSLNNL
ncbi:MAG: integration host factor subunit beta [Thermodesulfovibrionales bacterium]|nr:integration host factor subunit beta [Thermodesulfovibrionales bacterium]